MYTVTAYVGPIALTLTGAIILVGSLLTSTKFPYWHPFMGILLLVLGPLHALKTREVVRLTRRLFETEQSA